MKRFYPKIYVSKSGKRYFVVNERKVYINSKLTKKEIMSIYNLLKKNIKSKAKKQTNRTASTIIISIQSHKIENVEELENHLKKNVIHLYRQ